MHILLVDDIDDTRDLFSMAFVLEGHRTSTASSGIEALELFTKHRFDGVLLDIEMPNVNGWKVLELIRQLPFGEHVPVIMFSAHHNPNKEQRAIEAGAYALLRKPMMPTLVIEVMQTAVSDHNCN
jgi:CheY-like chemotaxis protein